MTDPFDKHLNDILVDTFHVILKAKRRSIKNCGESDLSINEMHLLNQRKKIPTAAARSATSLRI